MGVAAHLDKQVRCEIVTEINEHVAIIKANNYKEYYHVYNNDLSSWEKGHKPRLGKRMSIKDEVTTIGKYTLNSPILRAGDTLYLHELDRAGAIDKVIRSTDNSYVYLISVHTNDNIERVTEEDLKKAEIELEKINNKHLEWLQDKTAKKGNKFSTPLAEPKDTLELTYVDTDKKKWYEFW